MERAKLPNAPEVTTLLPLVSEGPGQRSRNRKKRAFSNHKRHLDPGGAQLRGKPISQGEEAPKFVFCSSRVLHPRGSHVRQPFCAPKGTAWRSLLSLPAYSSASKMSPSWRADSFTEAKVGEFSVSSFACVENAVNSTLSLRLFSLSGTRKLL